MEQKCHPTEGQYAQVPMSCIPAECRTLTNFCYKLCNILRKSTPTPKDKVIKVLGKLSVTLGAKGVSKNYVFPRSQEKKKKTASAFPGCRNWLSAELFTKVCFKVTAPLLLQITECK
jgi:hypothetical protein